MDLIRLQNMTPEVYTQESRDFQLLCRLYDCVFNCIKFDIDTVLNIIDTSKCRTSMLQLLATKMGFFTTNKYDDDTLRCILEGFLDMMKYKGSLRAIEIATNIYLKTQNVNSKIEIKIDEEDQHLISIRIFNENIEDITVLEDLLSFILPFGMNYEIKLGKQSKAESLHFYTQHITNLLFEKSKINSQIASNNRGDKNPKDGTYSNPLQDKYINQVGTVRIIGENDKNDNPPYPTNIIKTYSDPKIE